MRAIWARLVLFMLRRWPRPAWRSDAAGRWRPTARGRHLYRLWVVRHDRLTARDKAEIARHIARLTRSPFISLLMPLGAVAPSLVQAAVAALEAQLYRRWEICVAVDRRAGAPLRTQLAALATDDPRIRVVEVADHLPRAAVLNAALAAASGAFALVLDVEDRLAPQALYLIVAALERDPDTALLYSDEDVLDRRDRRHFPWLKSAWNPELALALNLFGRLCAFPVAAARAIGGFRAGDAVEHDLALRLAADAPDRAIRHLPQVLYHRRAPTAPKADPTALFPAAWSASRSGVADYLAARGESAEIVAGAMPGSLRLRRELPDPPPLVSLIVPTRDKPELLRGCIESLRHRTDYPSFEIIIVDNDSRERATLDYLAGLADDPRIRVLAIPGPFDFSGFNNRAVAVASGEVVGFINNDTEVIAPGWLREMVSHAMRPAVGAVGAKLYYRDDTIQHAGIALGIWGGAGHDHRHFPRHAFGYFGRLQTARNLSAVTGASLVMRRAVFTEVGGFDEVNFKITFSDVDLCLRVRAAGYDIVWTPYAELYHLELASRGSDSAPANAKRFAREFAAFKAHWADALREDPFRSPNLSCYDEGPALAFPPRARKPWRGGREGVDLDRAGG